MRALLLTTAALLLAMPAGAQDRPWQRIQRPPIAQVQRTWVAPPAEYGPEPYFGMNGMNVDTIDKELDRIKALGFQAVTAQYGKNAPFGYMSKEYLSYIKLFVAAAKKRGMRVWLVDDAGYPSGFAGGKITNEAPALRMRALIVSGNWPAAAGAAIDQPVPADFVSASSYSNTRTHQVQDASYTYGVAFPFFGLPAGAEPGDLVHLGIGRDTAAQAGKPVAKPVNQRLAVHHEAVPPSSLGSA